jgi:LacI family transcriptional regulator
MHNSTIKTKRPSMEDVARKVGVSRATVSYVLNNVPNASIPDETQARIWAAVNELGYRPNAIAKGLRGAKSNVVGFITDDIVDTPFTIDIIKGAQDVALANNKMFLMMDSGKNLTTEKRIFQMVMEWQVEGILFATTLHREISTASYFFDTPTILVDCFSKNNDLPSFVPNEEQGGYVATEALLKKGHKRIGFINGPEYLPASIGRFKGYQKALADFDVPFDPTLVRYGDWWQESGYDHTLELMSLANPPTGIFCANDWIAMGAYDALKKLGLSIPKDVAVVGFDNREVIASHMHPSLTTVALPYYEMGKCAMEHLLSSQNPTHPIKVVLDCPLIIRESI